MKTLALAFALSLAPAFASAQTPPSGATRRSVPQSGPIIDVDGIVARPYFWLQSRSALHYQPPAPRRAFAPTVVSAVRRAPF